MKNRHCYAALLLTGAAVLGGCAAPAPQPGTAAPSGTYASAVADSSSYGTIDLIRPTRDGAAAKEGSAPREAYQINVRLDDGKHRTIVQDNIYDLAIGNRVHIVDGRVYRP
ncbi:outer membrane lipoprotein SlyB [Oxalobacteraceae bacterium GrIS 1.11]